MDDMELPAGIMIRVQRLGKCYRIYDNPRDRLKQAFWRGRRSYYREFWALHEVSFAVAQSETVGIVGRNGSGKSTLLQLICGTLTPSEGVVQTRGRVAALLELGSGFNPEFTGIENVYLNASLLGLSKAQVDERLDDILAFADIGTFVHQPVKTYSSGMTVRLAFAVISHVDADILIVDEALAVGDAYFTQKCMRFIHRYREQGSLLFVSHDTTAITGICDRAILLDRGRVTRVGPAKEVSEHYGRHLYEAAAEPSRESPTRKASGVAIEGSSPPNPIQTPSLIWRDYRTDRINGSQLANYLEITQFEEALQRSESFGNGGARLVNVVLSEASTGLPLRVGLGGECVILRIEGKAHRAIAQPIIGFILKNEKGLVLLGDNTNNRMDDVRPLSVKAGQRYWAEFEFILPLLPAGNYSITSSLAEGTQLDHQQLHWLNDSLILQSACTSIAAGLAGVAMQAIRFDVTDQADE